MKIMSVQAVSDEQTIRMARMAIAGNGHEYSEMAKPIKDPFANLGLSLLTLASCDGALFMPGWENDFACRTLFGICRKYNKPMFTCENSELLKIDVTEEGKLVMSPASKEGEELKEEENIEGSVP